MTITEIRQICIHGIGNKVSDEPNFYTKSAFKVTDYEINQLLLKYFTGSFKTEEYYNLQHDSSLKLNEIYTYVSDIFENPDNLFAQSINITKHLYEKTTHPKIKSGELYVVYFKDCIIENEKTDAVGMFKSENRESFLKVFVENGNYEINSEEGINISKLDKGCIIFNTSKEKGYLISLVDNPSKGSETQYWKDDFLHVSPRNDNYHQTQNLLSLCRNFVIEKLPTEFEASKADQADMLNKSVKFFKENDTFVMDDFTEEVMQNPNVIDAFNKYKHQFSSERDIDIADEFDISASAVKKQQRVFKSVIKLDKNFHIYVHGNREYIERGFDEALGMYFYKVFFKEEN
ncbi:MAG: nucleoid-associated protein [Bacteroidota bacterium]